MGIITSFTNDTISKLFVENWWDVYPNYYRSLSNNTPLIMKFRETNMAIFKLIKYNFISVKSHALMDEMMIYKKEEEREEGGGGK